MLPGCVRGRMDTPAPKDGAGCSWPCPAALNISVGYASRATGSCSTQNDHGAEKQAQGRKELFLSGAGWGCSRNGPAHGTLAPFCFPSRLQPPMAQPKPWGALPGAPRMNRGSSRIPSSWGSARQLGDVFPSSWKQSCLGKELHPHQNSRALAHLEPLHLLSKASKKELSKQILAEGLPTSI